MEILRKFLVLPTYDRWLLIKAAFLLEAIRLGVRLLPFRTLRRLLARAADTSIGPRHAEQVSTDRVTWAVKIAAQYGPGAKSCLTQALTTQVLLARRGYPTLLHIGVARGEQGRFQAHAWVESEGKVVIGGTGLENFIPLAVFKGEGS